MEEVTGPLASDVSLGRPSALVSWRIDSAGPSRTLRADPPRRADPASAALVLDGPTHAPLLPGRGGKTEDCFSSLRPHRTLSPASSPEPPPTCRYLQSSAGRRPPSIQFASSRRGERRPRMFWYVLVYPRMCRSLCTPPLSAPVLLLAPPPFPVRPPRRVTSSRSTPRPTPAPPGGGSGEALTPEPAPAPPV